MPRNTQAFDRLNTHTALPSLAALLSSFLISALSSHSFAEDDTAAQTISRSIETVFVSATRDAQSSASISSNSYVLDSEAIDAISHRHASELLDQVPGVWISRGNGQEHLTAIRSAVLTGAGSCGAFYIAEDGIPLRAPGFCNVNQLFDANTEQADNIELIRGPGTAVHGSNALNGVINIRHSINDRKALTLESGADDYQRAKLRYGGEFGEHQLSLALNASHDGGYKENAGYAQQKLSLRHRHQGEHWRADSGLSISNLNQETAGFVEGPNAYKDSSLKRNNPNPEAFRDSQSARAFLRLSRDTEYGRLSITPYLRYTDMRFLQHFLPGTPLEENRHHSLGLQTSLHQSLSKALELHYGADLDWSEGELEQSQVGGFAVFPPGQHYDYRVDSINIAVFSGAQWQASDSLTLNGGLRFEVQEYDYDNRMIDGATRDDGSACERGGSPVPCRYSRPSDRKDRFENLSAYAGLVQTLSQHQDLALNLVHGFRAPQATELYRLQAGQTGASLESEAVNSLELSLRNRWQDLQLEFTLFYLKKRHVIFQNSDRENIDDGATLSRGLEIDFHWQLAQDWSIAAQSSIAKHQYDNNAQPRGTAGGTANIDGLEVDTAPRQLHNAQLRWDNGQSRIELEWQYNGGYFTDVANTQKYDGHGLLNLHLAHSVTERIRLGLHIHNLANTDYAERADFAFGSERYFIGEPRAYFASVTLTL